MRTCIHDAPLGSCDVTDCPDRARHVCASLPCPVVGCTNGRPAERLGDAMAALLLRQHDREHASPINPRDYPIEAREVARRVDELARRDSASGDMTHGRGFIGIREDGHRNRGARPWHWCYGNQPIHVKGAVYEGENTTGHLVRGITEAQAECVNAAMDKLNARQIAKALDLPLDKARRIVTERNKRTQ